jgi:hypothetical protein
VRTGDVSKALKLGLYDDSEVYGRPDRAFPLLEQLHVPLIRLDLRWGGPLGVARHKPADGADPADPAYDWALYDQTVTSAAKSHIKILFSIVGTPGWANGGKAPNTAPNNASDVRKFAFAAATRYSGTFTPEGATDPLPAVRLWLAWNEPNNPVFLRPQFRKVGNTYVAQSAIDYAKICNAIYDGVHETRIASERVACGATAPRGNNQARSARASISPLVFLTALKKNGAHFDAYAHHPYYGGPSETPSTPPRAKTAVTLGDIGTLISLLTRLYGHKPLWITEYGYQTKPPDPLFGVSWAKQALYLRQAVAIARRNPRIELMLWFLLRDEVRRKSFDGWQSGLMTASGKKKPSFAAFARLER